MIASLSGKLLSSAGGQLVIEVSGVGYLVHTTDQTASSFQTGQQVTVYTSLVVREESLTLFGFRDLKDLEMFDLLMSVNGVGPKSALAVLGELSVDQIADAVTNESDATFKAVSGIGAKTAKLITLTLSGKVLAKSSSPVPKQRIEATVSALVGLGWSERQARDSASKVADSELTDQQILKAALKELSRTGKK